ncbi:uncharacterized protein [Hoplias malabaricus]|uniref:uncharacterized protein n=1 Tax=Hoplias malabaricus TaxID=27720 RepID=UPI003462076A
MAAFSSVILQLGPCIIFLLLTRGDSTDVFDQITVPTINKTVTQGETVVFHCNDTNVKEADKGWRKENITLFNYSPVVNKSVTNYTSRRMHADPLKLQISNVQPSDAGSYTCFTLKTQWILSIKEQDTANNPEKPQMFLYIILSVTGAVAVCLIIICIVQIHRKRKKCYEETGDEQQSQRRRVDHVQNRQYFERFNSLYGQVQ